MACTFPIMRSEESDQSCVMYSEAVNVLSFLSVWLHKEGVMNPSVNRLQYFAVILCRIRREMDKILSHPAVKNEAFKRNFPRGQANPRVTIWRPTDGKYFRFDYQQPANNVPRPRISQGGIPSDLMTSRISKKYQNKGEKLVQQDWEV